MAARVLEIDVAIDLAPVGRIRRRCGTWCRTEGCVQERFGGLAAIAKKSFPEYGAIGAYLRGEQLLLAEIIFGKRYSQNPLNEPPLLDWQCNL